MRRSEITDWPDNPFLPIKRKTKWRDEKQTPHMLYVRERNSPVATNSAARDENSGALE